MAKVGWTCKCGRRYERDADRSFEHVCDDCGVRGMVRVKGPLHKDRELARRLVALAGAKGGDENEKATAARALARLLYGRPELLEEPAPAPPEPAPEWPFSFNNPPPPGFARDSIREATIRDSRTGKEARFEIPDNIGDILDLFDEARRRGIL